MAEDVAGIRLGGRERRLAPHEIVVSKTDPKGIILYANDVFCRISLFREDELVGSPHNIVRHPFMPAVVFRLMWQRLKAREEVFAYVVNRCRNGDHYWVLAHVTPTIGHDGRIIGYHSSRRAPPGGIPSDVLALYRKLGAIEQRETSRRRGMEAAWPHLMEALAPWQGDVSAWTLALVARMAHHTTVPSRVPQSEARPHALA